MIAYVLFLFKYTNWKITAKTPNAIVGGLLSGLSSGIFGVGGAIRAAFLSVYNLEKATFIFTAGAIGVFIDSGRLIKYYLDDVRLESTLWIALTLAIPASLLGAYVGKKLSNKIPEKKFCTAIGIALLLELISKIACLAFWMQFAPKQLKNEEKYREYFDEF